MRLALSIDGLDPKPINPGFTPNPAFNPALTDPGQAISAFGNVALYVGGFLMFFWAAWGIFDYLKAEGNKEALAKARKKIQWAIIGFIILIAAFSLSNVIYGVLKPDENLPLTNITKPN